MRSPLDQIVAPAALRRALAEDCIPRLSFSACWRRPPVVALVVASLLALFLFSRAQFTLRNELMLQQATELEAKEKEVQKTLADAADAAASAERRVVRAAEIKELRDTASKLRRLVATARPMGGEAAARLPSVPGSSAPQPKVPSSTSFSWRTSVDEGQKVWQRLEAQYAQSRGRDGAGNAGAVKLSSRLSATTPNLPWTTARLQP